MNAKEIKEAIKKEKRNKKFKYLEILNQFLNYTDIDIKEKDKILKNKYIFTEYVFRSNNKELINYITRNLPETTKSWTKYWMKKSIKLIRKKKNIYCIGLTELENFSKISNDLSIKQRKLNKYINRLLHNCPLNKMIDLIEKSHFNDETKQAIISYIEKNTYSEADIFISLSSEGIKEETKNLLINNYFKNILNDNYIKIDFDSRFKILKYINDIEIKKLIVTNTIKKFGEQINKGKWDIGLFVKIIENYSNQNILNQYIDTFCDLLNKLINVNDIELSKNYLELVKILRNNQKTTELIEKNFSIFIESLIKSTSSMQSIDKEVTIDNKELLNITDIVIYIIKDVLKHEKETYRDIEFIGMGTYCFVLGINSKIIKIGPNREQSNIKNSSYILQPIKIIKINDKYVIELTEKVTMEENITEEELYQLYYNIREEGAIWTDIQSKNVGRLIKDNKIHYISDSKLLQPELKNSGLIGQPKKILQPGELVVCDLDYIYDEKDINNIVIPRRSLNTFKRFEKRYQSDKNSLLNSNYIQKDNNYHKLLLEKRT